VVDGIIVDDIVVVTGTVVDGIVVSDRVVVGIVVDSVVVVVGSIVVVVGGAVVGGLQLRPGSPLPTVQKETSQLLPSGVLRVAQSRTNSVIFVMAKHVSLQTIRSLEREVEGILV